MISPTHRIDARPHAQPAPLCRSIGCERPAVHMTSRGPLCSRCFEEEQGALCPFREVLADTFPGVVTWWQDRRSASEIRSAARAGRSWEPTMGARSPRPETPLSLYLLLLAALTMPVWIGPTVRCVASFLQTPISLGMQMRSHGEGGWMKP